MKLIHLLILLEAVFIGYSLSLSESLGLSGYIAGLIYFVFSFIQDRRVAKILAVYAVLLIAPRVVIQNDLLKKERLGKIDYTRPELHDCYMYPTYAIKLRKECNDKNEALNKDYILKIENEKRLANKVTIVDASKVFVIIIISVFLPLMIYFARLSEIEIERDIEKSIDKRSSFNSMILQNVPKEEIIEKLNIGRSTYYAWLKKVNE